MRYFVYISPTKVDMLYNQSPDYRSGERSYEFGFDFKFLKALLRKNPAPKDLIRKVEVVSNWLEQEGKVGTIEEPKEYFRGVLPMVWGPFIDDERVEGKYFLLFIGQDMDYGTICLGGSLKNVVGSPQNPELEKKGGFSTHYMIRQILVEGMTQVAPEITQEASEDEKIVLAIRSLPGLIDSRGERHRDNLAFLAKTLLVRKDETGGNSVILGTPIFVEQFG